MGAASQHPMLQPDLFDRQRTRARPRSNSFEGWRHDRGMTGTSQPTPLALARIGISGWTYPPWRGVFFPKGLPHRSELAYAAQRLNSIELNGSFYALQRPSSFRTWYDQ